MWNTGREHTSQQIPIGNCYWSLLLLLLGYLGLLAAILLAQASPAHGYEVSIYWSTPLEVWLGLAIAMVLSLIVATSRRAHVLSVAALMLGSLSALVIVALPVLRGYRYYGHADALTHLGWVREMGSGQRSFTELFYPATHSISIFYTETFGLPDTSAAMLMVVTMAGVFLLFVPLVVRAITRDRRATLLGAYSALLLLPVTNVSSGLHFHAFTMGVFFFPVFFYLLVRLLSETDTQYLGPIPISANELSLTVAGVALLFIHPQVTLNVLILLGAINLWYLGYRYFGSQTWPAAIRPIYVAWVILIIAWVVWIWQFGTVFRVGQRVLFAVEDTVLGTGEVGRTAQDQGEAASTVGVSVYELYFKLFFLGTVYTLFAILAFGFALTKRSLPTSGRAVTLAFAAAGVVLIPFFVAHFLGDISHLFFRHVAFGMGMVTVFGSVGMYWLTLRSVRIPKGVIRTVGVITIAIALVFGLAVAFPSPYIALQTHHVSDYQYDGYDRAFDTADPDIPYSGIRNSPGRYVDAFVINPRPESVDSLNETELRANPALARSTDFYLPVTQVDRDREAIAYREFRYTEASMSGLVTQPEVHQVHDNGEFTLYYVRGSIASDGVEGQ